MSCTKHVLFVSWTQHAWRRRLVRADNEWFREADRWGWERAVPQQYTTCLTQDVCTRCGAKRAVAYCRCDTERAEHCAFRVAETAGAGRVEPRGSIAR